MGVLLAIRPAAFFTDKNLHDVAAIRLANLSLEHGHCDGSTLAYAQLSMVLGPRFGDYRDGFRFGNLGLALVERDAFARHRGQVYTVVAYHVLPWTGPMQVASALMRRALDLAQEAGDVWFAVISSNHLISLRLAAGDCLEDVQVEAERHLAFARRAGFGLLAVCCFLGQLHLIRSLRGRPATEAPPGEPPDPDEATLEQLLEQDPRLAIGACWYWIQKLQARFHAGHDASAVQ